MRQGLCALAVAVIALAACGGRSVDADDYAAPRTMRLNWRESYGVGDQRLGFQVRGLRLTRTGWSVRAVVHNGTSLPFIIGRSRLDRSPQPGWNWFGVMLFDAGTKESLATAIEQRRLPPGRRAVRFVPRLPGRLSPGETWRGTFSGPGRFVRGRWLRVVFGRFGALGVPPKGFEQYVIWITDHARRI